MYIKLFGPEVFGSALNDKKNPLDLCKRILFHTFGDFFPISIEGLNANNRENWYSKHLDLNFKLGG